MSYSRRLKDSTTNPRGWVCIWDSRDDGNPADREAIRRWHGCKRRASDILTSARPSSPSRSAGGESGGASNRSRNGFVSSAPLGHSFSGGLFFALMSSICNSFSQNRLIGGFILHPVIVPGGKRGRSVKLAKQLLRSGVKTLKATARPVEMHPKNVAAVMCRRRTPTARKRASSAGALPLRLFGPRCIATIFRRKCGL